MKRNEIAYLYGKLATICDVNDLKALIDKIQNRQKIICALRANVKLDKNRIRQVDRSTISNAENAFPLKKYDFDNKELRESELNFVGYEKEV